MSEIEQKLQELIQPLQLLDGELGSKIDQTQVELEALKTERRRVRATLNLLVPQPKKVRRTIPDTPEKHATDVQSFLEARNGEFADGFNATQVHRAILLNGSPLIGKEQVRRAVIVLHERGVLRLDRRGMGGSKIYKLVHNAK